MKRTISAMMGKGSLNHNSRAFHADNTDPARSYLNIAYCSEDIRAVYHELFDEALAAYNSKQTRNDRKIENYYEKIRIGKQEKPFCELVIQIGNKDDCGAATPEGGLTAEILDSYMKTFRARNPNLRVFSAHMHMDEATPHLHIDFVPFITGSKRGLETRVSLKKALEAQGFIGGNRGNTEWNRWVESEKTYLARLMEERGIEWEHKGLHEEHLSVLDYKKQERKKEVEELEQEVTDLKTQVSEKQEDLSQAMAEAADAQAQADENRKKLERYKENVDKVERVAENYTKPAAEVLPEPVMLESAKSYRKRIIPIIDKITRAFKKIYAAYVDLKYHYDNLLAKFRSLEQSEASVRSALDRERDENQYLRGRSDYLDRAAQILGNDVLDDAVRQSRERDRERARTKYRSTQQAL